MIIDITDHRQRQIAWTAFDTGIEVYSGPGKKPVVGITSGCFDLFHHLHLVYLEKCRRLCDFLIVGVDSDHLVRHFKNKTPVFPEHHRATIVSALKVVDVAFIMSSTWHFRIAVESLGVSRIFKNHRELYGKPIVGSAVAEVVVVPDIEQPDSTSAIVSQIQSLSTKRKTKTCQPKPATKT